MAFVDERRSDRRLAPDLLRAPISGWAWRATIHHVAGFPVGLLAFVVTLTLICATAGLAVTVFLAVPTLALLIGSNQVFTAMQRSRFRAVLGVAIPPPPRVATEGGLRGLWAQTRAGTTWRQATYHLLAVAIGTVSFVTVTAVWSVGLATAPVLAYFWALPDPGITGIGLRHPVTLVSLTIIGVLLLVMAPWLAQALANVDAAAAARLLGPSRAEQLAERVDALTSSRDGAVDAADAERRRIERDLHDGTQQRLVSLAMNLGMARARLADAPEPTRRAVEEAHEEAKQALSELRGFIRGLHPAVLDDRGLDAAISGIAARAPLPVSVQVNMSKRCSPTIEAVAYFVISEALTNVARHANASQAKVVVEQIDDRLRILVADDGQGGATLDGGTGLRGLAQRTAAVDGTLHIDSPAGGPTVILAELPCER